ncbi:unnamed protein product [Pleuronectes platessa]|uniref:Uncharacterized protein n=1 Tax=Pleuronectes platessa TaxID=8262 RepID=A0A9N7Y2N9_PLEPL|nr:unnamed protein product [Pleuronectes platessa]
MHLCAQTRVSWTDDAGGVTRGCCRLLLQEERRGSDFVLEIICTKEGLKEQEGEVNSPKSKIPINVMCL